MIGFGRPSSLPSSRSSLPPAPAPVGFSRRSHRGRLLVRELPRKDPFALYAALRQQSKTCFLLESAPGPGPGPERLAEFTYLGFDPIHVYSLRDGTLFRDGRVLDRGRPRDVLEALRGVLRGYRPPLDLRHPKYLGGLVGYFSYDFAQQIEPSLALRGDEAFPTLELGLYLDGVVFDHRRGRAFYFSYGEDRFSLVEGLLRSAVEVQAKPEPPEGTGLRVGSWEPNLSQEAFEAAVGEALEAIRAGEVFQLVLSRRLSARYEGDLLGFYRHLRALNPSPYMYALEFHRGTPEERSIWGSSPEMLVAVQGRRVITYPIAGTRPVGTTPEERTRYAQELLTDEKEGAEHAMLVDLARNDVGRVSAYGSVRVPRYRAVERFSHVQHLVSRVEGRLRDDCDALEALGALFPAGTVTGAPKLRAMEWIERLEPEPRGPYAGVVGYLSLTGDLDTAIAIRTLFASRGRLFLQAGAGVVADSLPAREFHETERKLDALRVALEFAQREGGSR